MEKLGLFSLVHSRSLLNFAGFFFSYCDSVPLKFPVDDDDKRVGEGPIESTQRALLLLRGTATRKQQESDETKAGFF